MDYAHAVDIARKALGGLAGSFGDPPFAHALRVAAKVSDDPDTRIVAVLHDVIEDSDLTLADLAAKGLPGVLIDAVDLMTRTKDVTYFDYVRRIAAAPGRAGALARRVKLADLSDHLDRKHLIPSGLVKRYVKSVKILTGALS